MRSLIKKIIHSYGSVWDLQWILVHVSKAWKKQLVDLANQFIIWKLLKALEILILTSFFLRYFLCWKVSKRVHSDLLSLWRGLSPFMFDSNFNISVERFLFVWLKRFRKSSEFREGLRSWSASWPACRSSCRFSSCSGTRSGPGELTDRFSDQDWFSPGDSESSFSGMHHEESLSVKIK